MTLVNSLLYTSIAVSGKITLGLILAMTLERATRVRKIIRGIILLPWVVPICLSTLAWWWMFDPLYSVINWTLMKLGILHPGEGIPWLSDPFWARTAIIIVNVWRGLPFFAITLLAGLLSIPKDFIGITERLVRFANALVGRFTGGLGHVVVVTNMIWGVWFCRS